MHGVDESDDDRDDWLEPMESPTNTDVAIAVCILLMVIGGVGIIITEGVRLLWD